MSSYAERVRGREASRDSDRSQSYAARIKAREQGGDPAAIALGQAEVAGPGLPGAGLRFQLGRAQNINEMNNIFTKKYPAGLIERAPVTGDMIYKENARDENEDWKPLRGNLDNLGEVGRRLAEFGGSTVAPLVGEAAGLALTRGRNTIPRLAATVAGGGAGGGADELAKDMQGVRSEGASYADRVLKESAFSALGFLGGEGMIRMWNSLRGGGLLDTRPGFREAEVARQEVNRLLPADQQLPEFTLGQSARAPIFERFEKLTGPVAAPLREHAMATRESMSWLRNHYADGSGRYPQARAEIEQAFNNASNDLLKQITPRSMADAGKGMSDGLARYTANSKRVIDQVYDEARMVEAPQFDIRPLQERAQSMLEGMQRPGIDGQPVQLARVTPELQQHLENIVRLDPNAADLDALRQLSSDLFPLTVVQPGDVARRPEAAAMAIRSELRGVLQNPMNSNPDFVARWRHADTMNTRRETTLEKALVGSIAASERNLTRETLSQLAESLTHRNQSENLRYVRGIVGPENYRKLREAAEYSIMHDAIENPAAALARLDGLDSPTRAMLFPQARAQALRDVANGANRLQQSGVRQALERQSELMPMVHEIISTNSSAGVAELGNMIRAAGGLNSDVGKAVSSAILDRGLDIGLQGKALQVNREALRSYEKQIRNMGLHRLMSTADREMLRNMDRMSDQLKTVLDTGASLQGAETAAQILKGNNLADRMIVLLRYAGLARLSTFPPFRRWATGTGKKKHDPDFVRVLGGALARTADEIED
jgi:hypothetical protein